MKSVKSKIKTKIKAKIKAKIKTKIKSKKYFRNTTNKTKNVSKKKMLVGGKPAFFKIFRGKPTKLPTLPTLPSKDANSIPNYLRNALQTKETQGHNVLIPIQSSWGNEIRGDFVEYGRKVHNPLHNTVMPGQSIMKKNPIFSESTNTPRSLEEYFKRRGLVQYHDLKNSTGETHYDVESFNNYTRNLLHTGPRTDGDATSKAVIVVSPDGQKAALTETHFGPRRGPPSNP
jgi:hypothetical protein